MTRSNDTGASNSGTLERRKFLLTAGLGIGGAVAAAAGVQVLAPEPPPPPLSKQSKDQGYQATEHVRNYYRTARV